MKIVLLSTVFCLILALPTQAEDDEPSYSECFKMMETSLKAEVVTLQAEADALENPRNVPVLVPNEASEAATKRILEGVTLKIDPENSTVTPQVELEHYPLIEPGTTDEEADDTPPVVTRKELCKTLYGLAIQ